MISCDVYHTNKFIKLIYILIKLMLNVFFITVLIKQFVINIISDNYGNYVFKN